MFNWHEPTCRNPDVVFLDGLNVPYCQSCGEIAAVDNDKNGALDGTPFQPPSKAKFELCWPSSLPFVEEDDATCLDVDDGLPTVEISSASNKTDQAQPSSFDSVPANAGSLGGGSAASLYEPLFARKIRILRLLPGAYGDPIRGDLLTVDLASKPEYEALSYTWADQSGDTSRSQLIFLGKSWDIMAITVNCANALRRLRFPGWARDVWVDAICINQDDTRERSHQVGIMQYIYATAARVFVYLGEDADDLNPAPLSPWKYENAGNTLHPSKDVSGQSYFSRIWVIQEVASAHEKYILFGSKGCRWQEFIRPQDSPADGDLRAVLDAAERSCERLHRQYPWVHQVLKRKHRVLEELEQLLCATVRSEASDPRDKIFALLGLFLDAHNAGLVADYSLSKEQVFSGVMAFLLHQNPRELCRLLSMVQPRPSSILPSWAIDWSRKLDWPEEKAPSVPGSTSRTSGMVSVGDSNAIRFDRRGGLWIKGVSLFHLENCVFTKSVSQQMPPGIVNGIAYSPNSQEPRVSATIWAQRMDKVFAVAQIPHHGMILMPIPHNANNYNFVAICERPRIDNAVVVNTLDCRKVLLISAWNYILGDDAWYSLRKWQAMEDVCSAIEECWELLKGEGTSIGPVKGNYDRMDYCRPLSLCSAILETFRAVASIPYELARIFYSKLSNALSVTKQSGSFWTIASEVLIGVFVRTETTKKSSPQRDPNKVTEVTIASGRQNNTIANPLGLLRDIIHRLQATWKDEEYRSPRMPANKVKMMLIKSSSEVSGFKPRATLLLYDTVLQACWDWGEYLNFSKGPDNSNWPSKPDNRCRKDEWESGYMREGQTRQVMDELEQSFGLTLSVADGISLDDMLESLLGQRLDIKISALSVIRRHYLENEHRPRIRSEGFMQWLQYSVELREEPYQMFSERYREPSWGESFLRTWDLLTQGDIGGEGRADFFRSEVNWAPLIDLARETRARLFPLKEAFTSPSHFNETVKNSSVRHEWEDICIV